MAPSQARFGRIALPRRNGTVKEHCRGSGGSRDRPRMEHSLQYERILPGPKWE
jgi:hypothetical protein